MPLSCKILHKGIFDSRIFSKIFDIDTLAEWNTRLQIFNTDIDLNGNVLPYPKIDPDKLKQAINDFNNHLFGIIPDRIF